MELDGAGAGGGAAAGIAGAGRAEPGAQLEIGLELQEHGCESDRGFGNGKVSVSNRGYGHGFRDGVA